MSYSSVYRDPKQLKRDVRGVVLCVSAFVLTMSIVSVAVIVIAALVENPELIAQYADMSSSTLSAELQDAIWDATSAYAGLGSILGMLCGLPWFFLIRGKKFLTKDVTQVNSKVNISTILIMLVLIMGIQFFMSLIQIGVDSLFNQDGGSITDELGEATYSLATSVWGILYVVIIGPICEELVFRGAVMRTLERYGANFAIIISSLIFGLYHMILFQSVFAFLIGLVFAYTAGRFSIKWAIVLHMINNGLATLSVALGSDIFNIVINLCYMFAFVAAIIILIVGRKHLFAQRIAGAPSEPRVYARAFTSPWLIIYIVVIAIVMLTSFL